jgi:hypothetical protein
VGGHQEEVGAGMGNEAGAAHMEVVAVQTLEVVQRVAGAGNRAVAEAWSAEVDEAGAGPIQTMQRQLLELPTQ